MSAYSLDIKIKEAQQLLDKLLLKLNEELTPNNWERVGSPERVRALTEAIRNIRACV